MFAPTVLENTIKMYQMLPFKVQICKPCMYIRSFGLVAKKFDELVVSPPKALDTIEDDMSSITPNIPKTFNIAAYVNNSESLQNLLHLGVNLSKLEKKPWIFEKFLKLDFERDMKKHIVFITDFVGMDNVGNFISKNPLIFLEDLHDLETRVNYLISKHFIDHQINRIITKNPFWLSFSTVRIDRRFGYFQEYFNLSGQEVRNLATKQPKLITYNLHHVKTNSFAIKEEMGFEDYEVKRILLDKPKIWMLNERALRERFNYIHNVMKIDHSCILNNPQLLLSRVFKLRQRHLFLEKLGRAQYNPIKENFVPVTALIQDSDSDFCNTYAKCNVNDFNMFLKTL